VEATPIRFAVKAFRSPNDFDAFVETEFLVRSHYGDIFTQRLSDELAVEWVCMVQGHFEETKGMIRGVGQYSDAEVLDGALYVIERKFEFATGGFNGDFGKGNGAEFSSVFRIRQNSGGQLGEAFRGLGGENQNGRVEEYSHLVTPFDKGVHLLLGHGLPPVRVDDFDFVPQGPELWPFAGGDLCADDVDRGDTPAANSYSFAVLDGFDQLGELVFGVGYAYFHGTNDSYLR
jgi:hypothetical protein